MHVNKHDMHHIIAVNRNLLCITRLTRDLTAFSSNGTFSCGVRSLFDEIVLFLPHRFNCLMKSNNYLNYPLNSDNE